MMRSVENVIHRNIPSSTRDDSPSTLKIYCKDLSYEKLSKAVSQLGLSGSQLMAVKEQGNVYIEVTKHGAQPLNKLAFHLKAVIKKDPKSGWILTGNPHHNNDHSQSNHAYDADHDSVHDMTC